MLKIQRKVQRFILIGFTGLLVLSIINGGVQFLSYYVVYAMLWLVVVGVTQFFGSLIDVLEHRKKSSLRTHLQIAGIALALFIIGGFTDVHFRKLGAVFVGIAFATSFVLMFYYWYVIFFGYKKTKTKNAELRSETHSMKSFQ